MIIIPRKVEKDIQKALEEEKKVIVVYGPRQAGKTTLIKDLLGKTGEPFDYFTGDDLYAQDIFSNNEIESLKKVIKSKVLFVDEAQRIKNIGLSLKLIADHMSVKIIVSGSASFELADRLSEPLTGRTKTFWLYPLSFSEMGGIYSHTAPGTALEEMLRFGMYPEVHTIGTYQGKEDYLYEYLNSYLYKDLLVFEGVRKPKKVVDLLTLLALQIGQEVSIAELASSLSVTRKAIENYLDVLEKMFVLVNIRGFSRNLRKEISKTSKYYFVDIGLRNALIRNFNELSVRSDVGGLFENWFIMEKIKAAEIFKKRSNFYFWRTYDQQEIDLVEERDGYLFGYEIKWKKDSVKIPREWLESYENASFKLINKENFSAELESLK